MSKSAKKNAKRREKKESVADNWEDDDEVPSASASKADAAKETQKPRTSSGGTHTPEQPNWAAAAAETSLVDKLDKLDVK
jgi:partner of Y14 and mago protein